MRNRKKEKISWPVTMHSNVLWLVDMEASKRESAS